MHIHHRSRCVLSSLAMYFARIGRPVANKKSTKYCHEPISNFLVSLSLCICVQQINEECLNQLDDWFSELRAEAANNCPEDNFEPYDSGVIDISNSGPEGMERLLETTTQPVTSASLTSRHRITNPPYVLHWLNRTISQVEEGTASLSASNCSTAASSINAFVDEQLQDSSRQFLLHIFSEEQLNQSTPRAHTYIRAFSETSTDPQLAPMSLQQGAFGSYEDTDVDISSSRASTDTLVSKS